MRRDWDDSWRCQHVDVDGRGCLSTVFDPADHLCRFHRKRANGWTWHGGQRGWVDDPAAWDDVQ
jgi:hypothetical protein